jgi:hypothetical protein
MNAKKLLFLGPPHGYEFFDYQTPPNMAAQIKRDEKGKFALRVERKEK